MPSSKFKEISQEDYCKHFEVNETYSKLREKALNIALDIRKFEIELYWKRAAYFWTFIGAALTGFIAIQQLKGTDSTFWLILVGCLGFVFSVAWYCVNRGSKQWQENWENHVDLLEDHEVGPLYKVFAGRPEYEHPWWHRKGWRPRVRTAIVGPGPFSVTKINQIVSLFMIFLWIGLVIKVLPPFKASLPINVEYALTIAIALIAGLTIYIMGRTDKDDYEDLSATIRKTALRKKELKENSEVTSSPKEPVGE